MLLESYLKYLQEEEETLQEFIIIPVIALLVRAYLKHFSKAAKSCIGHNTYSKSICILEYRIKATRKIQSDLKKLQSKCVQTKNPEKCIINIAKKIARYKLKEQKLRNQLSKEYQKV